MPVMQGMFLLPRWWRKWQYVLVLLYNYSVYGTMSLLYLLFAPYQIGWRAVGGAPASDTQWFSPPRGLPADV